MEQVISSKRDNIKETVKMAENQTTSTMRCRKTVALMNEKFKK